MDRPDHSSEESTCDTHIAVDLAELSQEADEVDRLLKVIKKRSAGRPLKVLVNNAAIQILGKTGALSLSDWHSTMAVNVLAPALLSQAMLNELELANGSIINVASIHARLTKPGFVAYATSKAALVGLTRSMAVDLGSRVRVNAIAPAAIDTEMLRAGFEGKETAYKELSASHPIGRIGRPEEVAQAALFLASDSAGFVTGAILDLDGGIGSVLHDPA